MTFIITCFVSLVTNLQLQGLIPYPARETEVVIICVSI